MSAVSLQASSEQDERELQLLVDGSDFAKVSSKGVVQDRFVWFNRSLDMMYWGESRKSWRPTEFPTDEISEIISLPDRLGIQIVFSKKRTLDLVSRSEQHQAEWVHALRQISSLRHIAQSPKTSTPFNVQHVTHVNMNLEWTGDLTVLFELLEKLGEGSFGSVYRAKHRDSNMIIAAKLIVADNWPEIRKEIDILKQCSHANIVSYYGCGSQPDPSGQLWILMDYCDAKDVGVLLQSNKGLPEHIIRYILLLSVRALVYLHAKRIIHRDVKSGNILLTSAGGVKLADFGVSKQAVATVAARSEMAGSPLWMAPEVVTGKPVSFNADVWSLGITAIELAESTPPRANLSSYQAMKAIAKDPPPSLSSPGKWSKEFVSFVHDCLVTDPVARPSAIDLLAHPFLSDVRDESKLKEKFKSFMQHTMKALASNKRHRPSLSERLKGNLSEIANKALTRKQGGDLPDNQQSSSLSENSEKDEADIDGDDSAFATIVVNQDDDPMLTARIRSDYKDDTPDLAQLSGQSADFDLDESSSLTIKRSFAADASKVIDQLAASTQNQHIAEQYIGAPTPTTLNLIKPAAPVKARSSLTTSVIVAAVAVLLSAIFFYSLISAKSSSSLPSAR